MKSPVKRCFTLLCPLILLAGCSPRLYQPPPLGAEHRLDEGLRPTKNPSHLFGKDMNKYLQQQGIEGKEKSSKQTSASKQSHSASPRHASSDSTSHHPVAGDTTSRAPSTTPSPAK
ncbi:MAG TPA: hypothetical protein VFX43_01315 [Chitinophagaceae bacterium]|jgi:hypothetical protein|nr:hypothetical protein [Chitinophagaceae bacterium]